MIYTFTLNPSVDYIVQVKDFNIGDLNVSAFDNKDAGGKGINVSRVLKRLGVENTAFGFVGGFTGDYIKRKLTEEKINHQFIDIVGDTRINIKLKTEKETEINGSSPVVTKENFQFLLEQLSEIKDGDTIVLSGSYPSSLNSDVYKTIIKKLSDRNVKIVVDIKGEALNNVLEEKLFLIKPNHHELGEFFQVEINSLEEAKKYGKKLVEKGIENVIVSMADKGALLINKEKTLFANVPKGEVKNSVGAGDSVVGGFIAAYSKGNNIEDSFKYGVASGSATAFSIGLCTEEKVQELLKEINIKEI